MRSLAVLSHKGGTGKTTVAVHLAVAAHMAGRRTTLVDMDPQRSATAWAKLREGEGPVLNEARAGTFYFVRQAAEKMRMDLMVVDTAANCEADTLEAVRWADLCLIVIRPSFFDIEAMGRTIEAVQALCRPAVLLINQAPTGNDAAAVITAVEALERFRVPVLKGRLSSRGVYQTSVARGLVAGDVGPGAAATEVNTLWRDLDQRLEDVTARPRAVSA